MKMFNFRSTVMQKCASLTLPPVGQAVETQVFSYVGGTSEGNYVAIS